MSCVAQDCAIFHHFEIVLADDAGTTGYCDKEITDLCCLVHRHYIKSVHHCLNRLDRVYFSHNNFCAQTFGTHSHAFSTPAISCNNHIFACHDQVCGTVDTVKYRLSGSVTVVKQMLAVCIIYQYHREFQFIIFCHGDQADDTGCRLLTTSDDILQFILHLCMKHMHQITAVINDDIAVVLQNTCDMLIIFFRCTVIPCIYI